MDLDQQSVRIQLHLKLQRKLGQLSKYDFVIIRLDANELNKGPIFIILKAKLVINYIYFKFGLSIVDITIDQDIYAIFGFKKVLKKEKIF